MIARLYQWLSRPLRVQLAEERSLRLAAEELANQRLEVIRECARKGQQLAVELAAVKAERDRLTRDVANLGIIAGYVARERNARVN